MNKLLALFPLLWWFYIAIFAFAFFQGITRTRFAFVKHIWFGGFVLSSLFLGLLSFRVELELLPTSLEYAVKSYQEKIQLTSGGNFAFYYERLHAFTQYINTIHLYDVSTKEYLYARMYLYPSSVENRTVIDDTELPLVFILSQDEAKHIRNATILDTFEGKVLVAIERHHELDQ